jgi:hypothetical protein
VIADWPTGSLKYVIEIISTKRKKREDIIFFFKKEERRKMSWESS